MLKATANRTPDVSKFRELEFHTIYLLIWFKTLTLKYDHKYPSAPSLTRLGRFGIDRKGA